MVSRLSTRGVQLLGVAHLSYQGQSPGAAELALGSRTLMEQVTQGFVEGGIKEGPGAVRPRGFLLQTGQSLGVEGVDSIAGGACGAAEVAGDQSRVWPAALASRIWQRRKVKAVVERSPSWRHCRSVFVRVRTKVMTGLILHYSPLNSLGKGLFRVCTSFRNPNVWGERRNKIKALANLVRDGGNAIKRQIEAWKVIEEKIGLPKPLDENGFNGRRTPLLDAVELLDIHLRLEPSIRSINGTNKANAQKSEVSQ